MSQTHVGQEDWKAQFGTTSGSSIPRHCETPAAGQLATHSFAAVGVAC